MNTPIYDFVKAYRDLRPVRLHMPGHKGRGPLGCEDLDLTEIPGADSLYEASGIIAESEANASKLFGCPTFYSTEGSSHCIRAMLLLAKQLQAVGGGVLDAPRVSARDAATGTSANSAESPVGSRCESRTAMPEATSHAFGRLRQQATGNRSRESGNGEQGTGTGGERIAAASVRRPEVRPPYSLAMTGSGIFRVLAARNAHRAFLTAAALLDLDVVWLPAGGAGSYLSAHPTPEALDAALAETGAAAVYLTCPDYLGALPDLRPLAAVCHARGALLLVDNAHGAYLRFLTPSRHPMDLGADLCCDSAHKTLPVLTGGAYLHVSQALVGAAETSPACRGGGPASRPVEGCRPHEADACRDGTLPSAPPQAEERRTSNACPYEPGRETRPLRREDVRDALALFGSTSPSYLILQSLDLANPWLESLPEKLADFLPKIEALKTQLRAAGWTLTGDEPLKLTLRMSGGGLQGAGEDGFFASFRMTETSPGLALAAALEQAGIFCEFADPEHVVFMLSPNNTDGDLVRLEKALKAVGSEALIAPVIASGNDAAAERRQEASRDASLRFCSLREAMLAPAVRVPAGESLGRVLARPGVSCPPAVPILMPGEVIDKNAIEAFEKYGIEEVSVLL